MDIVERQYNHNFFQMDNEVFEFGLDVYQLSIIFLLYKHADSEKKCFPGISTMQKVLNISKPKVISSLKVLEGKNLIKIIKEKTKNYFRNRYILINIKSLVNNINQSSKPGLPVQVNDVYPNNTHINNTQLTIKNIASQSSASEQPDLFTTKPKKEKPAPKELVQIINGKPDFNESESLHKQIEGFFYHFNKSGYRDFKREGRSINNIIKRAKLYYPEFPERDTLRTIIQKFYELKEQQAKFWKDQPFLPSTLDVKRMWDMLIALIEEPKKEESRLDDIFDRLEKKYQPKRIVI